ncbi:MAG: hypothetical protein HRT44_01165 [Bdellovibrionales bacterium]|nr:spondin domain-containing protein [Bdellovibrionales bacterium]NQZ17858.1 hypothetical protein [Bdellovibrionales bacterium]
MKTILILLAGIILSAPAQAEVKSQKYKITFTSKWNVEDHLRVPGNAHFSPIVAVSHNGLYDLLPIGGITGKGLELVAELGNTRDIEPELDDAMTAGNIENVVITENQFISNKLVQTLEVTITNKHEYLSFVSMIAPSPDWVVGLSNLKLHSAEQGFFPGVKDMPLFALDAGTESGDFAGNFSINNNATTQQTPINVLSGNGFNAPFATVTIAPVQ